MSDVIRKAVELADGWYVSKGGLVHGPWATMWPVGSVELSELIEWMKDALAAQLVRQVDALTDEGKAPYLDELQGKTVIYWAELKNIPIIRSSDRTMNTIKTIVDSGVLKSPDDGEKQAAALSEIDR